MLNDFDNVRNKLSVALNIVAFCNHGSVKPATASRTEQTESILFHSAPFVLS